MNDNQISNYDRIYGGLIDIAISTKPSTIKVVEPITGRTETFIVQTVRHEDGDFIFLECANESGLTRIVIPPKVSNAIASHRDSLTKRNRSRASRNTMRDRIARGDVPTFKKKK